MCVCEPGGSLSDAIVKKQLQSELFSVAELKDLLLQVSMGLKYIHSSGLVHLDIKPSSSHGAVFTCHVLISVPSKLGAYTHLSIGNIFICQRPSTTAAVEGESEEEDDGGTSAGVIYKIGITSHVKCISTLHVLVS